ncbi:MAG TPA: glycosyltransferase family 1 protein [Thermomicrobiales bacterium]|nr:glycosyltransferase family 1 protein [Thermomicrobiales bacterium]
MTPPCAPARVGIGAHLLSFAGTYRQAGVSRYIAELLRAFARDAAAGDRRHAFVAFTGPARPPAGFVPPGVLAWRHSRLPTARPPARIAWEQALAPAAARRERLALYHAPVNVLPPALPCPGVVTVHDVAFLAHPEAFRPAKRRYLTLMTGLSARRAARVIAVSGHTRDELVRRLGVPAGKVRVVYNGVDPAFRPLPAAEVARFRAARGLPARTVLYLGTLEPRKNLRGLLDAFARLDAGNDVGLVVAGAKGWLYDDVFAAVEQLGLGGRVRFVGHVPGEELPLWYNAADVFAYPSLYEGFGLPPLEAMACGTPVVTSATSVLPEVVGDAGLLADPRDPADLATALARALGDAGLRRHLRERGPARAATFSWARAAAETLAVYDEVLARRGRR